MKTLLLIGISVLLLSACNKNQRQIVKLDGKWNVISAQIQGYGESNPDLIYEFEYCKIKHSDFCDFSIHSFETNEVKQGVYSIINHGETLAMTISSGFGYTYREYELINLSNRKLILKNMNVSNGELSQIELKRVKD